MSDQICHTSEIHFSMPSDKRSETTCSETPTLQKCDIAPQLEGNHALLSAFVAQAADTVKVKNSVLPEPIKHDTVICTAHRTDTQVECEVSDDDMFTADALSQTSFCTYWGAQNCSKAGIELRPVYIHTSTPRIQVKIGCKFYHVLINTACSFRCIAYTLLSKQKLEPITRPFTFFGMME
ncbi:hypothetical protein PR048_005384 [Dryococelus australis]|uniref:Uncharacterized protein n=1 Tax=Dryococelus australis TaxID=614101 RepID=A0ABQ9I846_9NEOP|nr:hypothetical protein PR048_005384 [Dryococelus australis]